MDPLRLVVALTALLASIPSVPTVHELSFDERVEAQRAIERVAYGHRIGATLPFEVAVPRAALEEKVRTYLRQSLALERFWKTPVTSAMLARESARMAAGTRMPERLRELRQALGNDPSLIDETLVRAALVDRLSRHFFANDPSLHLDERRQAESLRERLIDGALDPLEPAALREVIAIGRDDLARWKRSFAVGPGAAGAIEETSHAFSVDVPLDSSPAGARVARYTVPKKTWDSWWASVSATLDPAAVRSVPDEGTVVPGTPSGLSRLSNGACVADDTWDNGSLDDVPALRTGFTAVWTGAEMIVWGGAFGSGPIQLDTGSRYDPATDSWRSTSTLNAPSPRSRHTAVWTGTRMVVWGGTSDTTGGQYDPVADAWTPTSTVNAPAARTGHTAVWSGTEMIVWGGGATTGGRYDPATDSWSATSTLNAPSSRIGHTAVWTGTRMIVWGGIDSSQNRFDTGALYDPASDSWTALSTTNAPPDARFGHTAVWTGTDMIVWGGNTAFATDVQTGGLLNLGANAWTPTSLLDAPEVREAHTAIWTGSRMIVWGGVNLPCCDFSEPRDSGGIYDPSTDSWIATSLAGAPAARDSHAAFWTGDRMLVWGGQQTIVSVLNGTQAIPLNSGGRYDPATDSWTPTSLGDGPASGRAVWSGSEMIVWGAPGGTGGRYDPALDAWTPVATTNAPEERSLFSMVWAGSRLIVWGGSGALGRVNTGGIYDPVSDSWSLTSVTGAPSPRSGHTAVWSGSRMIVWGGRTSSSTRTNTGGVYDPAGDTWTATTLTGAPAGRDAHTALWTGAEMIVWGGATSSSPFVTGTGGRYDPATDAWVATSLSGAPSARSGHTAVWTGDRMVVWGGSVATSPFVTGTGGRYDPATDAWVETSLTAAPTARSGHSAVWSGKVMVVWGGSGTNTGGRYDPIADDWKTTSTLDAPAPRSGHAAVWTGAAMIVWGGSQPFTGGSYGLDQSSDDDGDGFSACSGDCNDADASIHPGAAEICDGVDNDCDGVVPAGEIDADADGVSVCQGDCDDANASVHPGAVELPGNPIDENCDGILTCDSAAFYKTHGQFVSCVSRACASIVSSGLVPQAQCDALISHASLSNVGRRQRTRQHPAPTEP